MPSAQTYTGSRSSSRRRFHVSYSACQLAFSRAIDAADSGAAAPRQPSQRQIEVPVGQPVQVQLGQEPPHFLRPPLEQRQQPTLEAPLQSPHPRPPHRDRPAHQTEPARLPEAVPVARRREPVPDSRSELLACVAAFGRSLDESFDPARFLAEFSARTQRLVPHDDMLILLREEDGQTYSLFAEYAVRGSLSDDNRRYTTAFERGGRAAAESFALTPVFGGEAQLIADMATDDRFGEAAPCWKSLREAGFRARLAVPPTCG